MKNIEQLLNEDNWIEYLDIAKENSITNKGIAKDIVKEIEEVFNLKKTNNINNDLVDVCFDVGDKVLFNNEEAIILWTSRKYVDLKIIETKKIFQGVSICNIEKINK